MTGARIGAPVKLIDAKTDVTLDFASDAGGDLASLYARLAAEAPARKVGYRAIEAGRLLRRLRRGAWPEVLYPL